ncbi:NAD-P-binding protein [Pilatotrama ljubarskyi]|nr:NAD-P-binding protein [Pilatotrama ljubarskyi]
MPPFILISPATRGLSLALIRHYLRTTSLPVFGTYRPHPPSSEQRRTPDTVREHILQPLQDVDPARLHVLPLDFTSEESIAAAADALAHALPKDAQSYIRVAFFLAGILYPERQPADLVLKNIAETFNLNVIAHLLFIKHFSRFLPPPSTAPKAHPSSAGETPPEAASASALAKWVHVSARVGSISDNALGGWYSYRASKAALNQVIRTFDLHLQAKKLPAISVGVHPGTVKTGLSKAFWSSVKPGKLFEPEYAAERLVGVVKGLGTAERGKVWDWKGEQVKP